MVFFYNTHVKSQAMVSSTALAFESHAAEDLIMQEGEEEEVEESGRGKRLGTEAARKRKNDAGYTQKTRFICCDLCSLQFICTSEQSFCSDFHLHLGNC